GCRTLRARNFGRCSKYAWPYGTTPRRFSRRMKPSGGRGMSKRTYRIRVGEPLLDIVSYGRGGPRETGGRLTTDQLEQIRRTVRRTPEAVVKVLPRASNDFKAV